MIALGDWYLKFVQTGNSKRSGSRQWFMPFKIRKLKKFPGDDAAIFT
jgi:hypothetical protein